LPARSPLSRPETARTPIVAWPLLAVLAALAWIGLRWGASHALTDSADLILRQREVARFVRGLDPYALPDMTYPPTAPPVFAPLIAPFGKAALKVAWLGLNLAALVATCATILRVWGREWPAWLQVAFCLAVAASKPVRGGMGLGQFHLLPTAMVLLSVALAERRREFASGILMGLALTKPTMALPFLGVLLARGRWRALAIALGFQAALMVGVSAWLRVGPVALLREWFARAREQLGSGMIDAPTLAHRAWPDAAWAGPLLSLLILGWALAATIAWRRKAVLGLVSLAASAAATFTYHRPYDLVLLIPVLAYLIEQARADARRWAAARVAVAAGLGALLIVPKNPAVLKSLAYAYDGPFVAMALGFLLVGVIELAAAGEVVSPRTPSPASDSGRAGRGSDGRSRGD